MSQSTSPDAVASQPQVEPRSRALQRFWERYFAFYDTLNESPPYRRMVERHAELLQPRAGDVILDAGSGTANVTQVLAVPGANVTGIDFCEPALVRCRHKVPSATFRVADLTRPLPFDTGTFDKVACSLVLHYLVPERQRFAVTELARVLKPGGRIAVTVFATGFNTWRVYTETLRDRRQTDGLLSTAALGVRYLFNTSRIFYYVWRIKRAEKSGDYQFATDDELRALLVAAGLTVHSVEPSMAGQCWTASASLPAAGAIR